MSPLHLAAIVGQSTIIQQILSGGRDVNLRCPHFHEATPLHMASASGNGASVPKLLKGQGADINIRDEHGGPPLQWEIDHEIMDNAMCLIKLGASLDVNTIEACMSNDDCWPCTELILETVRSSSDMLRQGEWSLQLCAQSLIRGYRADSKYHRTTDHIIKKRVGLGAIDPSIYHDPECAKWEGDSSLHVAATNGFPKHLFKLLLSQDPVNINSRDVNVMTVLDNAKVGKDDWKVKVIRDMGGLGADIGSRVSSHQEFAVIATHNSNPCPVDCFSSHVDANIASGW